MTYKLSIIIPTYNTAPLTVRCIQTVLRHPPSDSFEIIVVDNHSRDETCAEIEARFPDVVLLRNASNAGFARACNRGAERAQGQFLLFLNSDTEALEGTFDHLTQWLEANEKTGIVGPELFGAAGEILQMSWVWNPLLLGEAVQQYFAPYALRRSRFKRWLVRFLQRRSRQVPSMCGACFMIRREAFDQVGGFDENFELYFEDSDLCLRCKKAGWKIDFVSGSRVVHHLGQSSRGRSWNTTSIIYQQSHIAYYKKHAAGFFTVLLKIYLLLKWVRLCAISQAGEDDKERSAAYVRAYLRMILEKERLTLDKGVPSLSVRPAVGAGSAS
jgi:GT2 family glycosyltransferase